MVGANTGRVARATCVMHPFGADVGLMLHYMCISNQ
jgi:hypothetical protein